MGMTNGEAAHGDSAHRVVAFSTPLTLNQLAAAIIAEHEALQAHPAAGAAHAFKAGKMLFAAKRQVREQFGRRQWLAWRKANCGVAEASAQAYMHLHKHIHLHPDSEVLLRGSFTKALSALAAYKHFVPRAGVPAEAMSAGQDIGGLRLGSDKALDREHLQAIALEIIADLSAVIQKLAVMQKLVSRGVNGG